MAATMSEIEYDPHRSVSVALTEVRTVLSRARIALQRIGNPGIDAQRGGKFIYAEYAPHPGDDLDDMRAALARTVSELERWERHKGARPRGAES